MRPFVVQKLLVIACLVSTAVLAASGASASTPPAGYLNFVACPIVRDTEPTPCWLAEHEGELYYLGLQQDTEVEFFPPQQGHKALIEGKLTNKPRICGGIPLEPVKATTLPEIDRSCSQVLPADGWVAPPAARGALPRLQFAPEEQLATDLSKTPASRPAPAPPTPPYKIETFIVPFDFEAQFMLNKATRAVQRARRYAVAVAATRVEIIGYRGAALLSDGTRLVEADGIAQRRAARVATAIQDLGVGAAQVVVRSIDAPIEPTGINDYAQRRVDIIVTPGKAD